MSRLLTITFTTAAFGTEAAYGSLKPPPTRRLRRAHLHLSYSMALARLLDTIPTKNCVRIEPVELVRQETIANIAFANYRSLAALFISARISNSRCDSSRDPCSSASALGPSALSPCTQG